VGVGILGYPPNSGSGGSGNTVYAGGGLSFTTNPDGSLTFYASGAYLTFLYDPSIIGSKAVVAGNNVTLAQTATGLVISAQVTGSGATSSGSYWVANSEPSLPNSVVPTQGNGINITTGAGSATIGVASSITGAQLVTWAAGDTIFPNRRQIIFGSGLNATYGTNTLTLTSSSAGVTSVDMTVPNIFGISGNPITTAGTLALTLANQASGLSFCGPVSGAAGIPTFRQLTYLDMPLVAGSNITLTPVGRNWVIASTASGGGGGGVSSVDVAAPSSLFTSSGGPITTSGTITLALTTATSGLFWGGPLSGGPAAPTYRAIVVGDLPTIPFTKISGTVPVGQGGTNLTATPTNGQLPIGTGAGYSLSTITPGTGVQITNGSGTITVTATGALGGTVQSIAQTVPASLLTISGSPITGTGTLAIGLATAPSGQVWAGPTSGAAATPGYRSIVVSDLPSTAVNFVGNLSPIFTSSITAQTLNFALTAVSSGGFLAGPATGAASSPTYRAIQGQDLGAIVAGSNITITPIGNTISIAAAGGGGGGLTATSITTSATAAVNTVVFVSLVSGNVNLVLPSANGQGGKEILVKVEANTVPPNTLTINATAINGSGTMDGDATLTTQTPWDGFRFVSNNTNNWSQFA